MSTGNWPIEPHPQRRPQWLLGALGLAIASSLLLPSAAPARPARGSEAATQPSAGDTSESGESSVRSTRADERRERRERRSSGGGRCAVQAKVTPEALVAGEAATVIGSLECPTASDAGEQAVSIYQRTVGTPGYTLVGSTTTETGGAYEFTTAPLVANSILYARSGAAHSRRTLVRVAPLLTLGGPPDGSDLLLASHRIDAGGAAQDAIAGNTITFSGTVSPDDAGGRVVLQRETRGEGWRRIGLGQVSADGGYSITHTFHAAGEATVRTVVRVAGLLAGASEPLSYEIEPRQNPRLTLNASTAGPLSYGQSLTLSGTAAGAANEQLTLLARSGTGSFAPMAQITTDADGDYEVSLPAPQQSSYYRVLDARTHSSTIFAGVRPTLTAAVSAGKVAAGESVTFSGTVTPAHPGQVVYLERQNPGGVGFHAIASDTLGAGSGYSIEQVATGTGPQVYRVKVARDEETDAVSSEPFTVEVEPAPAAALQQQAPGGALPGEP